MNTLIADLQAERFATTAVTGSGYHIGAADLVAARRPVDAARAAVVAAAGGLPSGGSAQLRQTIARATQKLGNLATVRAQVDGRELSLFQAVDSYRTMTSALLDLTSTEIGVGTSSLTIVRQQMALASISQAKEAASAERGYFASVLFLSQVTPSALASIRQAGGAEQAWVSQFRDAANPAEHATYQRVVGPTVAGVVQLRERAMTEAGTGQHADVNPNVWFSTSEKKVAAYRTVENTLTVSLRQRSGALAAGARRTAWTLALLLLGVVGVSAATAIVVAVRMARQVGSVRRAVLDVAETRLPEVMERLGRGEPLDPDAPMPITVGSSDEIGQLAEAANILYTAAVIRGMEALTSRSVGEQIISIGRRVRGQVERQLTLLDGLEAGETDSEKLGMLFRLDNVVAQTRRFVEGLFVLADDPPPLTSQKPEPMTLLEVARGALSEVHDYERVEIGLATASSLRVKGPVATDLTHALAELIANAATFSPSNTTVIVRSERAQKGHALIVEDRGSGIGPEALSAWNTRLAQPLAFDPAASAQLGLAVVARLARRHGLRVQLRESVYGGVDAVVLIPHEAFEPDPAPAARTSVAGRRIPRQSAPLGPAPTNGHRPAAPTATGKQPSATATGPLPIRPVPAGGTPGVLPRRSGGRHQAGAVRERGPAPVATPSASTPPPTPEEARDLLQTSRASYAAGAADAYDRERPTKG
ncbi:MAG: sensor histidine kinase [Frankia sp.]